MSIRYSSIESCIQWYHKRSVVESGRSVAPSLPVPPVSSRSALSGAGGSGSGSGDADRAVEPAYKKAKLICLPIHSNGRSVAATSRTPVILDAVDVPLTDADAFVLSFLTGDDASQQQQQQQPHQQVVAAAAAGVSNESLRAIHSALLRGDDMLDVENMQPTDYDLFIYWPQMQNVNQLYIRGFMPARYMHIIRQMPDLMYLAIDSADTLSIEALRALCSTPHVLDSLSAIEFPCDLALTDAHLDQLAKLPSLDSFLPAGMTRTAIRSMVGRFRGLILLAIHPVDIALMRPVDLDGIELGTLEFLSLAHMDLSGEDGLNFINVRLRSIRQIQLNSCILPNLSRIRSETLNLLTIGKCNGKLCCSSPDANVCNHALYRAAMQWDGAQLPIRGYNRSTMQVFVCPYAKQM